MSRFQLGLGAESVGWAAPAPAQATWESCHDPHTGCLFFLSISKTQQQLWIQLEFPSQENPEAMALRWDPLPEAPRAWLVMGWRWGALLLLTNVSHAPAQSPLLSTSMVHEVWPNLPLPAVHPHPRPGSQLQSPPPAFRSQHITLLPLT